jgi:ABC-type multidrug transport system ATPase subunit
VSAHLAAEILLVDEVLSVGDAAFQRKCQERIREIVLGGRTVLLVTHSMTSVRQVCDRAIVLAHGRIRFDGDTDGAIESYLEEVAGAGAGGRAASGPADGLDGDQPRLAAAGSAVRHRSKAGRFQSFDDS